MASSSDVESFCGSECPAHISINFQMLMTNEATGEPNVVFCDVLCETHEEGEPLEINEDVFSSMPNWIYNNELWTPIQKILKWVQEEPNLAFRDEHELLRDRNEVSEIIQKYANNHLFVDSFEFS